MAGTTKMCLTMLPVTPLSAITPPHFTDEEADAHDLPKTWPGQLQSGGCPRGVARGSGTRRGRGLPGGGGASDLAGPQASEKLLGSNKALVGSHLLRDSPAVQPR